jgi:hypothetical protein
LGDDEAVFNLQDYWNNLSMGFNNEALPSQNILAVLSMLTLLSVYEFFIYRFVTKRSYYSKQFNIALAVLPYFIATIIMTMESNLMITLGTIGALAIIRFRTAIREPMDMIYLLWSIHNGVVCGSGLYGVGILTSVVVTLVMLLLNALPLTKAPLLLIVHARAAETENEILGVLCGLCRYYKVRSRNINAQGLDLFIEIRTKSESLLLEQLAKVEGVANISLSSYDGEHIV